MKFGFGQLSQSSPLWAKRLRNYGTLFLQSAVMLGATAPANVIHDKAAFAWCMGIAQLGLVFICGMVGVGDEQNS